MKKWFFALLILGNSYSAVYAQDDNSYRTPAKEVMELLLAKPTPSVSIDGKAEWMLLSERNSYPTVEELGQPELRIAGLRINPNNFSPSRQNFINNFTLQNIKSGQVSQISGLRESSCRFRKLEPFRNKNCFYAYHWHKG